MCTDSHKGCVVVSASTACTFFGYWELGPCQICLVPGRSLDIQSDRHPGVLLSMFLLSILTQFLFNQCNVLLQRLLCHWEWVFALGRPDVNSSNLHCKKVH